VAVFKPHNIGVVGPGVPKPTLLDLVRDLYGKAIFPVHRLDRVTCGITVFAKGTFAKHALDNAFKRRLVKKLYYAVVEGCPQWKKKSVSASLAKENLNAKSGPVAKQNVAGEGQMAVTNFRVIRQIDERFCLIEANPVTGRMHQIRVHLAHLGLPIVGDKLYGAKTRLAPHTIALGAVHLQLPMPKGGQVSIDATKYFVVEKYLP
jgi:23S rRNA pseudouridine1911/1915/1917 synthase